MWTPMGRCAVSSRDLFAFISAVGILSLLFNYQISYYDASMVDQRLPDRSRNLYQSDGVRAADSTEVPESLVLRRSLSEHLPEASKSPDDLLQKIHEVERRLMKERSRAVAFIVSQNRDNGYIVQQLKGLKIDLVQENEVLSWVPGDTVVQGNWSEMFCFGNSRCPMESVDISRKVDMIPLMQPFINNLQETCNIAELSEIDRGTQHRHCEPVPCNLSEEPAIGIHVHMNNTVVEFCNGSMQQLEGIRWYLPETPVTFPEGPLIRVLCLVTSFAPLRLYIHQTTFSAPFEALQQSSLFKKMMLEDLLQYISETYGLGTSSRWWAEIRRILLFYFTHVESQIHTHRDRELACRRCFQSIQVDITCNSVQKCRIIQVKADPKWEHMFMDDIVAMVTLKRSVSPEIAEAVEHVLHQQTLQVCGYEPSKLDECLSDSEIIYLLDWRREMEQRKAWIQVYPSNNGCHKLEQTTGQSHTKTMNKLLMKFGEYFHWSVQPSLESHYLNDGDDDEYMGTRVTQNNKLSTEGMLGCSNEPKDFGKLASIHTFPKVNLEEMSPRSYNGSVDYHTILLKIWAIPKCCSCQIRLENKYNEPGAHNLTLGLGENRIMLYLVDSKSQDLDIVNTVTITIYRKNRGLESNKFDERHLKICTLKQECSLKFDSAGSCGLIETSNSDLSRSSQSRKCTSGDHEGQWIVPCKTCADENTCFWSKAAWQPYECRYRQISPPLLRHCLFGKKLLFIGDSTNRGITNFIIQQINGSLYDWDKTHTSRSYSNVNHGNTQFTFAYYPHFWLPADHRPKFSKVIYQLIKSSLPLQNNSNTVLVVGGVHWLARQHIDLIIEALQRKGLSGITKVVKGLGAGFHQPVENVRFVPKMQQPYLQQREMDILNYAKSKDFHVVATFNMTVSRYKDFMEGKCACHFHKVSRHGSDDDGYRYSVEGDTNTAYSQILLNQICS